MILPSIELLEKVLDIEIEQDPMICNMKETHFEYWEEGESYPDEMSFQELFFKLKAWALEENYICQTHLTKLNGCCFFRYDDIDGYSKFISAKTEIEALIKACEEIYKIEYKKV